MAGSETREEEEKAGGGGSSGWSTIRLRPLFFCIFFVGFLIMAFFFFGGFSLFLLLPYRSSKICIYSARVPLRVRNQVSIKLILFFEV